MGKLCTYPVAIHVSRMRIGDAGVCGNFRHGQEQSATPGRQAQGSRGRYRAPDACPLERVECIRWPGSPTGERLPDEDVAAPPSPVEQAVGLVQAAADAVDDVEAPDDAVRDLVVFAGTGGLTHPTLTADLATALLPGSGHGPIRNGWQPADVMHVVRSGLGNRFSSPVAGLLVQQALQQRRRPGRRRAGSTNCPR